MCKWTRIALAIKWRKRNGSRLIENTADALTTQPEARLAFATVQILEIVYDPLGHVAPPRRARCASGRDRVSPQAGGDARLSRLWC